MERAPITSWDGQSRSLTPIWEDYYPSANYFSHENAIHSEYESALSASYHQVEEEKSFPHLMPFFEGFSSSSQSSSLSSSLSSSNPNTHRESNTLESYISQTPSHSTSSSLSSLPSPEYSRNTTPRSSGGSSSLLALNISQEIMSIENPIILPYIPVKLYNSSYPNFPLSESQPLPYHPSSSQETLSIEDFSKDDESDLIEFSEEEIHDITSSPRKRRIAISDLPKHQNSATSLLKNINEEDNINLNDDDDDKKPKKRQRTNPEQLEILENVYKVEKLPGSELRKELAGKLKMTPRRVQVWFQNKRAKEKRMGTGSSPSL